MLSIDVMLFLKAIITTTEIIFIFNKLIVVRWAVVFADIFMTKLKEDVMRPINPLFYNRFDSQIASKIYYRECSCRETYIGETIRNVEIR